MQEFGIDAYFGQLQIAYRESISSSAEHSASLEKKIGDVHNSASVCLSVHPDDSTAEQLKKKKSAFRVVPRSDSLLSGRPMKREQIRAVENGITSALLRGMWSSLLHGLVICNQTEALEDCLVWRVAGRVESRRGPFNSLHVGSY